MHTQKKLDFCFVKSKTNIFFLYNDKYTTISFFKGLCHVKIKRAC